MKLFRLLATLILTTILLVPPAGSTARAAPVGPSPLGPDAPFEFAADPSGAPVPVVVDPSASAPSTAGKCTRVLIDQGHSNYYSINQQSPNNMAEYISRIRREGFDIAVNWSSQITYDDLSPYAVYVINLAGRAPSANERSAMQRYVQEGGGLFLIADWGGLYSDPSQALANVFGVRLDANTVTDPSDFIDGHNYWVTYYRRGFAGHEIMKGLQTLQTYASTSMQPGSATPLVVTDSDASPASRAVAVALNYGAGRVVIVGDSNWFSLGSGENYYVDGISAADNGDFAVNITKWLTSSGGVASTDRDGDGLPNAAETNGWINAAGTFKTDPDDRDSDDDGLTDGEEQSFDTNPNNAFHPGLSIPYSDLFKTREYFGWKQHGAQYLARRVAVLRRGSRFAIAAPSGSAVSIQTAGGTSNLTTTYNSCTGRWEVSIPWNATVGAYRITASQGSWSASLQLNVIFELPSDLDSDSIRAYLYDDDPAEPRDDTSIWFATAEQRYTKWLFWTYHKAFGFGLTFRNDQFKEYVQDEVMKAIAGYSNQAGAAAALAAHLDKITRFDPTKPYFDMDAVLHANDFRNQCSNLANALTSFARSAGLAARPVMVDWDGVVTGSGKFDHSTEVWVDSQWKVMRGYNVAQGGEDDPKPMAGGSVPPTTTSEWGKKHYPDNLSDVIVVAGPAWSTAEVQATASPDIEAYTWDNGSPNDIYRREWLVTRHVPYWTWKTEPARKGDPAAPEQPIPDEDGAPAAQPEAAGSFNGSFGQRTLDDNGDGLFDRLLLDAGVSVTSGGNFAVTAEMFDADGERITGEVQSYRSTGSGQMTVSILGTNVFRLRTNGPYNVGFTLWDSDAHTVLDRRTYSTAALSYTQFARPGAYFVDRYTTAGIDRDGNGRYDVLDLAAEIAVVKPGAYRFNAVIAPSQSAPGDGLEISSAAQVVSLNAGSQVVHLQFDGRLLFMNARDDAYRLEEIVIAPASLSSPEDIAANTVDTRSRVYTSPTYAYADFESPGASFTGNYSFSVTDSNGDGLFESLDLAVGLALAQPGTYRASADLTDAAGAVIARANWQGAAATARLQFDGLAIRKSQTNGPYFVRRLRLSNAEERIVAFGPESLTTPAYMHYQFASPGALFTGVFGDHGQDVDGNGLYDFLVVQAQVTIATAGEYQLDGWLTDARGTPITWAASSKQWLAAGAHTLQLRFSGEVIYANRVSGAFSLAQARVTGSNTSAPLDERPIAYTTSPYDYTQFEGGAMELGLVFADNGENGAGQWTADYPWALSTNLAHSPTHAWTDSPAGMYANNLNARLTSARLNLADLGNPQLSFWTQFSMEAGADYGYVEGSADNGATWQNLATFTGKAAGWRNEVVSLSAFAHARDFRLRFRLQTNASVTDDGWTIDDIRVYEGAQAGATINLPLIMNCRPTVIDTSEPNDSFSQAYGPLASSQPYRGYITSSGDRDYFYVDISGRGLLSVAIDNIPAPATDIDVNFYDSQGRRIAGSWGTAASESIAFEPLTTGRYYVEVYFCCGEVAPNQPYTLVVTHGGNQGAGDIYGTVRSGGYGREGVPVRLTVYDNATTKAHIWTVTDTSGRYSFWGAPTLAGSDRLYLSYPGMLGPQYIGSWSTATRSSYQAGNTMFGGDMDISPLSLIAPNTENAMDFPIRFQWQPRGTSPAETYQVLVVATQGNGYWWSPNVGHAGEYLLSGLPNGLERYKPLYWEVAALDGSGGYGYSYYANRIVFGAGGQVEPAGLAPAILLPPSELKEERKLGAPGR